MIKRIEEYPEEFMEDLKWNEVISIARNVLPTEEIKAIDAALARAKIDRWNGIVMKTLAGEEKNIGTQTAIDSMRVKSSVISKNDVIKQGLAALNQTFGSSYQQQTAQERLTSQLSGGSESRYDINTDTYITKFNPRY